MKLQAQQKFRTLSVPKRMRIQEEVLLQGLPQLHFATALLVFHAARSLKASK